MKKQVAENDFLKMVQVIAAKLSLGIKLTVKEKRLIVLYRAQAFIF